MTKNIELETTPKVRKRVIVQVDCPSCHVTFSFKKYQTEVNKLYACTVCNTEYSDEVSAQACLSVPTEIPAYSPGTRVRVRKTGLFRKAFTASLATPLYRRENGSHVFAGFTVVKGPIEHFLLAGPELDTAVVEAFELDTKAANKKAAKTAQ